MPTDWITLWLNHEGRTGKRPSPSDPESKRIYFGVRSGAAQGKPDYVEFWKDHKLQSRGTDWIKEWQVYEARTGKRPSPLDPESNRIYWGVTRGVRQGFSDYVEFWKARKIQRGTNWIKEWQDYEARTGKRPSVSDPDSKRIYIGVYQGAQRGAPGYRKFFQAHRATGVRNAH